MATHGSIPRIGWVFFALSVSLSFVHGTAAAGADTTFQGDKSAWREGFARFDFLMDENTLDIQPFQRDADERFGLKDPPAGKRRCVVIVPKQAAYGSPWSWQGCYWDHQPQAEVELLKRGFRIAAVHPSIVHSTAASGPT